MNRYKSYKKVDLHWLNQVPSHWELTRIKRLFYIHKDCSGTDLPIILTLARDRIKIRDISDNAGQLAADYTNYNKVKIGDLILNPMDLYSGPNCNISYVEGVISPAYTKLRKKKELYEKYFDYCFKLQYILLAFQAVGKGVSKENRWTLNNETLLNYLIPIPPLPEQKQIANYLDWKLSEIDKLIYLEKEKIKKLNFIWENKLSAIFNNLKTNETSLKNVLKIPITDGPHETPIFSETGIPFISVEAVENGRINLNKKRGNISRQLHELYCQKAKPMKNDIFIVKSASVGKIALLDFDEEFSIWSPLALIRVNDKARYLFMYYLFQSEYFQKQIRFNSSISTQPNIGMKALSQLKVKIPSLKDQDNIARICTKLEKNINKFIQNRNLQIKNLEILKQSLISEVVTGQIDVQNIHIPKYEKVTNIDDAEVFNELESSEDDN